MATGRRPFGRDERDSMIGGATDAGQGFVYSGQIEKGQMHGKGTLVYPNGEQRVTLHSPCLHCRFTGRILAA
jgi:hypothetical protein